MQEQYTDALRQLQQLVQQLPSDYAALAQLLTLLRRVGRAQEGQGFLQTAQEHASRAAGVAGADGTTCLVASMTKRAETKQPNMQAAYHCPFVWLQCQCGHPHASASQ